MIHIKGDIVEAFKNHETDVMIHQVNCQGVMGSGIAKQIRAEYPKHYDDYVRYIENMKIYAKDHGDDYTSRELMGDSVVTNLELTGQEIVGVFGQDFYGSAVAKYGRHTNYAALIKCLSLELDCSVSYGESRRVAIPKNIGCGLGGGNWNIVETLINDIERMYNGQFIVYEL